MELTSLDIKEPGLRILPPGVERYVVCGGGLSIFEIFPEDQIEIINNEGKQLLEIAVFNNKGKTDSSILNLKENLNLIDLQAGVNLAHPSRFFITTFLSYLLI